MQHDLFVNTTTEIYYDDKTESITALYRGIVKYEDWVEHLDYALDLIDKFKATKWLSITLEAKVIPPKIKHILLSISSLKLEIRA